MHLNDMPTLQEPEHGMVWSDVSILGVSEDLFNAVDLVERRSFSYIHIFEDVAGCSLAVRSGQRALLGSLPRFDSIN